jgi:hypothetical protein
VGGVHPGIREGPSGRCGTAPSREHDAQQQKRQAERLEADKRRIVEALLRLPGGETKTAIRDRTALSSPRFNTALIGLLDDGDVLGCEVFKSNWKRPVAGYKLAESQNAPD